MWWVEELIPETSEGEHSNIGTIGFAAGFVLMMIWMLPWDKIYKLVNTIILKRGKALAFLFFVCYTNFVKNNTPLGCREKRK